MTGYLWQLTSLKVHLKAPLPFPSVTCVQAQAQGLSWKLSSQTWEQEAGCKGTTQPHPEVCQALASLPLHLKYSLEREWEAGGSPYTWHHVVFLPGRAAAL